MIFRTGTPKIIADLRKRNDPKTLRICNVNRKLAYPPLSLERAMGARVSFNALSSAVCSINATPEVLYKYIGTIFYRSIFPFSIFLEDFFYANILS